MKHQHIGVTGFCHICRKSVTGSKKLCVLCAGERKKKYQDIYYKTWYAENGRKRPDNYIEIAKNWVLKNPEKRQAALILQYAIKKNKIRKPIKCSKCKRKTKLQGHHLDYNKPFDVIWLCASCHKLEHNSNAHL